MNIDEMKKHFQDHCVPDHYYVIDELGAGEVDGIALMDGKWCTYYSERGERRNIKTWNSEAEAVAHIVPLVEEVAKLNGDWKD